MFAPCEDSDQLELLPSLIRVCTARMKKAQVGEETFRDMNTVCHFSDQDVNWRPPVLGHSTPVQVKEPFMGIPNGYL